MELSTDNDAKEQQDTSSLRTASSGYASVLAAELDITLSGSNCNQYNSSSDVDMANLQSSPLYHSDPWSTYTSSSETAEIRANESHYYESLDLSFEDIADLEDSQDVISSVSRDNLLLSFEAADNNSNTTVNMNDEQQQQPSLYPTCGGKADLLKTSPDEPTPYILGTLIVRVVAARNLARIDSPGLAQAMGGLLFGNRSGSFGHGGSRIMNLAGGGGGGDGGISGSKTGASVNPYASVRFGSTTQRTSQVFGTVDPIWPRAETMYLDVTHPPPHPTKKDDLNLLPSRESSVCGSNTFRPSSSFVSSQSASTSTSSSSATPFATITRNISVEDYSIEPPLLTVGVFHANADNMTLKKQQQKHIHGDSNDVFLGMAVLNLTSLLTGKSHVDEWLPLSGGPSTSKNNKNHNNHNYANHPSVRLVCEYEPSDPPPFPGDSVQFTRFCRPTDLYPVSPFNTAEYTVKEGHHNNDLVVIEYTSREGWTSSFVAHRYMLLVTDRHYGAMDIYQEEMVSIAQRLSHSPLVNVLQDTVSQMDEMGLVTVGLSAAKLGVNVLNRWFQGGLETVTGDLVYATNWDGRFNPDAETSLATTDIMRTSPTAATTVPWDDDGDVHDEDDDDNNPSRKSHCWPVLPNMPSCPITQQPMRDPVVAADGHTYERTAILRWLQTSDKSPLTGSVLPHMNLVPNYMLLSSLQEHAATEATALTSSIATSTKILRTDGISVETFEDIVSDVEIFEATDVLLDE